MNPFRITAALAAVAALLCLAFASHAAELQTVDTVGYQINLGSSNKISLSRVAEVPLGKLCVASMSVTDPYRKVYVLADRMWATMDPNPAKPGEFMTRPRQVWAKCAVATCTTPKPADEERSGQCPSGTTGAWTQKLQYQQAAYPDCWKGDWLPASPPADACVVPNRSPTIIGTPAATAQAGQSYSFTPAGADPDGDTLAYSIGNKPSWASFSTSTGTLSGTPVETNVGSYANITISVSDGRLSTSLAAFSISVEVPPNRPPTISGTPPSTATVGQVYTFTPTASDPDGDTLTFAIDNRPPWGTFDTATGTLSGTPKAEHVGVRSEIRIRVSDGKGGEAVLAFGKLTTVAAVATTGSVTLSWLPSTQNTDGSALTDLAGYKILYGTSASALSQVIQVPGPVTSYVVERLSPATHYFAVRSYNAAGKESVNSNIASKTLP